MQPLLHRPEASDQQRAREWPSIEPPGDLKVAGESMTFAECDDMLDCIAQILNEHGLNGQTHAEMMRWKFRQLAEQAASDTARIKELEQALREIVIEHKHLIVEHKHLIAEHIELARALKGSNG